MIRKVSTKGKIVDLSAKSGKFQTKAVVRIDLDGYSIEEAIQRLQDAAEGLEQPTVNVETNDYYGDPHTSITVEGWQDATETEIQQFHDGNAKRAQAQRDRDERELSALRHRRPELFT